MNEKKQPVIQVELFHLGALDQTASQLKTNTFLLRSGFRWKTVLRFFDENNRITHNAAEWSRSKSEITRLLTETAWDTQKTPWWRTWFTGDPVRKALLDAQRMVRILELQRKELVLQRLDQIIERKEPIAEEKPDWTFKYISNIKRSEIIETVAAVQGMWIFAFEADDLLSEEVTAVSYAM